jgi:hypothetical protein
VERLDNRPATAASGEICGEVSRRAIRTASVDTAGSHRLLVDLVPAPQILRCSTVCSATTYGGPMNPAEHAECGRSGCSTASTALHEYTGLMSVQNRSYPYLLEKPRPALIYAMEEAALVDLMGDQT